MKFCIQVQLIKCGEIVFMIKRHPKTIIKREIFQAA